MKKILIILMAAFSLLLNAQEHEHEVLYILEADSTWLKEVIKFPLGFAQNINFEGYEDLRFAKNWSKPDGNEFFTYAFVWNINLTEKPTVTMIEDNMKLYYDGLMAAVNKDKGLSIPKTKVDFKENSKDVNLPTFIGSIQVYDSFFTKEIITLNVSVETLYCEAENKYIMLFRVSTQKFDNVIWSQLKSVKLIDNFCEIKY
jgi:hypothetical protein